VVRAGFSSVLRTEAGLNVVGSAPGGEEALVFLKRCAIQVLLLDLHMPGMSGIETLLASQKLPSPPQAIILSSFEPDEEVCRAVEMGARGYLRKDTSCGEIIEAIHSVHSGSSYLPQWIMARISERTSRLSLSPRELEIMEMVSKGLTNKEIARVIQVSPFTVRNHVRHIIAKLEVGSRTEAVTVAIQQGILMAHDSFPGGGRTGKSRANLPEGQISWLTLQSESRGMAADQGHEKSSKIVRGDQRGPGPIRSAFQA
jgi:DNA-binding NarL/FixJ family response regulator